MQITEKQLYEDRYCNICQTTTEHELAENRWLCCNGAVAPTFDANHGVWTIVTRNTEAERWRYITGYENEDAAAFFFDELFYALETPAEMGIVTPWRPASAFAERGWHGPRRH